VEFVKQVKVVRQATAEKGEMQLKTEQLFVEPDTDIAYTDLPVTILQQPGSVVTGTGMRFDKKADTMQLFNRVHVHYERAPVAVNAVPAAQPGKKKKPARSSNKTRPDTGQ
jgi:lipopolysaccharide export system protein LptC